MTNMLSDVAPIAPLLLREPLSAINDNDLLALFGELGRAVAKRKRFRREMSSWPVVVDYLRSVMANEETETFRVLFLNIRNHLLADEVMFRGTVNHVPVYPREVAKRALQLGATALIIAHNHPSGDPTPSNADILMTKELVATLKPLGITIHDHIIVGRDDTKSLRTSGLME
jgi:DNA repair protein RadC